MIASSGIAEHSSLHVAVRNAFRVASDGFNKTISCIFLFVSGENLEAQAPAIQTVLQELAPGVPVFGGSAESVLGTGREVEGQSAASVLLLGDLPEPPRIVSLECLETPDGATVVGFDDELMERARACNGLLIVGCPLTFSIDMLIDAIEPPRGQAVLPILGGYCSSRDWQAPNLLFCNDQILQRGAVALALPRSLRWQSVVSQGCRPIGDPMIITALDGGTILGLAGRPAMQMLQEMFRKLPSHEAAMAIDSLLIGRAITEYSDTFSHGDFLIRNVQGIDPETEGIVVTDRFHVGQTVRFHVRDAIGADADLMHLLNRIASPENAAQACLLFSCNGRGQRMFPQPNHDVLAIDRYFPGIPMSGFFAAGEFAPLANRNLTHGFTAVAAFLHSNF